jgi:hypothetical protein
MGVTISHTLVHINNNHQLSCDSLLLALTGLLERQYLRVAHQLLLRYRDNQTHVNIETKIDETT